MTTPAARRWLTFGDVSSDWAPSDLVVSVRGWDESEALAIVGGVRVRVRRQRDRIRWRCFACGVSFDWAECPHTRALAMTVVPPRKETR